MALSVSKRCDRATRGGQRLLFTVLTSVFAACTSEAVIENKIEAHQNAEMQASEVSGVDVDRESRLSPRRSFLRQEIVSTLEPTSVLAGNVEISSQGNIQSATASSRIRTSGVRASPVTPVQVQAGSTTQTHATQTQAINQDTDKFTLQCVNFHEDDVAYAASLCQSNGDDPSNPTCPDSPEAGQACCVCEEGGARFQRFDDTQCTGEEGFPKDYADPVQYTEVSECMTTCSKLEDCSGFSVINSGTFAPRCVFRKGRLRYYPGYSAQMRQDPRKCKDGEKSLVQLPGCGNKDPIDSNYCGTADAVGDSFECLYFFDEANKKCTACAEDGKCLTPSMAENKGLQNCADKDSKASADAEGKLPLCSDETTLQNKNCTKDHSKAAPRIKPIPKFTVTPDDVYDKRDCYVKKVPAR